MRKTTLLGFAVAAACAGMNAQAQTANVTLYGRLNTSFENTKVEGQISTNQVVNNNSRFGIKGEEKLGGDLSAIFQIESAISSDSGGGTLAGRDTWVGLKSGAAGTVKLGNITSPTYYATYDYISMHNHDTGNSSDALLYVPATGTFRNKNTVQYESPSFNGFQITAQYSLLDDSAADANGKKDRHAEVAMNYDNGPLHVGAGYMLSKGVGANRENEDRALVAAVSYDFKAVVVGGLFERAKSEDTNKNRNYARIAAMVPLGNHELHANIGRAGKWSGTDNTEATQWTLGYNYNLSKRTKVYSFYTKIDNKSAANYHNIVGSTPATVGKDERSIAVGVRHNF